MSSTLRKIVLAHGEKVCQLRHQLSIPEQPSNDICHVVPPRPGQLDTTSGHRRADIREKQAPASHPGNIVQLQEIPSGQFALRCAPGSSNFIGHA